VPTKIIPSDYKNPNTLSEIRRQYLMDNGESSAAHPLLQTVSSTDQHEVEDARHGDDANRTGNTPRVDDGPKRRQIIRIGVSPHPFARILALDAGGAGIVSSLAIIHRLLKPKTHDRGEAEAALFPCEHFELICGSEWGGILAIMLGRLRMVGVPFAWRLLVQLPRLPGS
jgi:hypothetical protein